MKPCGFHVVCLLVALIEVSAASSAKSRLLKKLLQNEDDILTSPMSNTSETVHVQLALSLLKVVQMDAVNEQLRTQFWVRLMWSDHRLTWDVQQFDDLSSIYISPSNMWTPDISLYNDAKEVTTCCDDTMVRIFANGSCMWPREFRLSITHCPVDARWFPFDEQRCDISFESKNSESKELDFSASSLQTTSPLISSDSAEWTVLGSRLDDVPAVNRSETFYTGYETPFTRATFTVHLQRKSLQYSTSLLLPCWIFSFISLISLLLQPGCPERIQIGVAVLLALSIMQIVLSQQLPAASDTVPFIGLYFLSVLCLCAVSLAASVLVAYVHNRSSHDEASVPMKPWLRTLICQHMAACVFLKTRNVSRVDSSSNTVEMSRFDAGKLYLRNEFMFDGVRHYMPGKALSTVPSSATSVASAPTAASATAGPSTSSVELLMRIRDILEEKQFTKALRQRLRDNIQQLMNDWTVAAAVIDRICFIFVAVCFIAGTLGIIIARLVTL